MKKVTKGKVFKNMKYLSYIKKIISKIFEWNFKKKVKIFFYDNMAPNFLTQCVLNKKTISKRNFLALMFWGR